MNKNELLIYLKTEIKEPFMGWNFSHIKDRWESDSLSWSYKKIINNHLEDNMNLLDMGTGGGEFLLGLDHPHKKTSVTESYSPNIQICLQRLAPLGITVYPIDSNDDLPIEDGIFDIVLNRHEDFSASEVNRILKSKGIFITQQVGKDNNSDLAKYLNSNYKTLFPEATLKKQVEFLEKNGFEILFKKEEFPKLRFFDIGAFVYFANIIDWEFQNFNIDKCIDKLYNLYKEIETKGFISSTEHRYVIVAKKRE
jgi:SAM-dependent methyltransferase